MPQRSVLVLYCGPLTVSVHTCGSIKTIQPILNAENTTCMGTVHVAVPYLFSTCIHTCKLSLFGAQDWTTIY